VNRPNPTPNGHAARAGAALEVVECLRSRKQFVMCAHERPDGDVLGSGYALGIALKRIGKNVVYFLDDDVPKNLLFLPEAHLSQRTFEGVGNDAIFVFFDMSDQVRAGQALAWVPKERIIDIDHHLGNTRFGRWNYVAESEAATGALVLDLVVALGVDVTPDIATCLLAAVLSDTGCFMYSNATPRTLRLGAALVDAGADKDRVVEQLYQTRSFSGQKLLGRMLDAAVLTPDGICYSIVTLEMMATFDATHDDLEDAVGALRAVEHCEVAILFKETPEQDYRLSLRSRGRVNVMEAARLLGGGGHFRAAGASVSGPREQAVARVLEAVRAQMVKP